MLIVLSSYVDTTLA